MPTSRLMFFLFFLVLVGSLVYLKFGPSQQSSESATMTPKQYIERVEGERQAAPEYEKH